MCCFLLSGQILLVLVSCQYFRTAEVGLGFPRGFKEWEVLPLHQKLPLVTYQAMVEQGFNLEFYLFGGFKNRLLSRWWGAREGLEEADVKHVMESMQVTRQLHPIGDSIDSLHDSQTAFTMFKGVKRAFNQVRKSDLAPSP